MRNIKHKLKGHVFSPHRNFIAIEIKDIKIKRKAPRNISKLQELGQAILTTTTIGHVVVLGANGLVSCLGHPGILASGFFSKSVPEIQKIIKYFKH